MNKNPYREVGKSLMESSEENNAPKKKLKKLQEIRNSVKYNNKKGKIWYKNAKGGSLKSFLNSLVKNGTLGIEDLEAFFGAER